MIPVLTSFLPYTNSHLYLPVLFSIWEAFNSSVLDDRLLEFMGDLSEENVGGKNATPEGGADWKDVGIWTQNQWDVLLGKALGSMSEFRRCSQTVQRRSHCGFRCSCWSS